MIRGGGNTGHGGNKMGRGGVNSSRGGIKKPRGGGNSRSRGNRNAYSGQQNSTFQSEALSARDSQRQRLHSAWENLVFDVVTADESSKQKKLQQLLADDKWSRALVFFESINECIKMFDAFNSAEKPIDLINFRKTDEENEKAARQFSVTERVSAYFIAQLNLFLSLFFLRAYCFQPTILNL